MKSVVVFALVVGGFLLPAHAHAQEEMDFGPATNVVWDGICIGGQFSPNPNCAPCKLMMYEGGCGNGAGVEKGAIPDPANGNFNIVNVPEDRTTYWYYKKTANPGANDCLVIDGENDCSEY